jgi:CDP-4-dehydro-6-deoxyglucose reductase, E3
MRWMSRPYTVLIQPHGRRIEAAANRPVLEAALDAGLNLPHSCRSGHCGSCRARLLSGEIHYPNGRPLGLTEDEARSGHILMCQALPRGDLTVEARLVTSVADVEIKTLPCRIERLERLAPDVMQVLLRLPSVERLRFQAGQYLDVLLEDGRRRSFSIASPPHDGEPLELHVRRAIGGGFSELLFSRLEVGSLLRIEGPVGQFVYRPGDAPLLMIAGGTGFAPMKSILRHVLEQGVKCDIHLYWGARQPVDVYEEARVLAWVREHPQLRFTAVLSDAETAGAAHRRLGWVHEVVLADYPDLSGFDIYVAGPPALVEAVRTAYPARGGSRLYFDSFDYAPPATLTSVV